jgi:hypothetical protein
MKVLPAAVVVGFTFLLLRSRRVEWLAAAAGGENGTVVGWVRVVAYPRKARDRCSPYSPPRTTAQIYPRRRYETRNFLRQLIG